MFLGRWFLESSVVSYVSMRATSTSVYFTQKMLKEWMNEQMNETTSISSSVKDDVGLDVL